MLPRSSYLAVFSSASAPPAVFVLRPDRIGTPREHSEVIEVPFADDVTVLDLADIALSAAGWRRLDAWTRVKGFWTAIVASEAGDR